MESKQFDCGDARDEQTIRETFYGPTREILRGAGGIGTCAEMTRRILVAVGWEDTEANRIRVRWVKANLVEAGWIYSVDQWVRGIWKLTDLGWTGDIRDLPWSHGS